jgi:hypothetical protein
LLKGFETNQKNQNRKRKIEENQENRKKAKGNRSGPEAETAPAQYRFTPKG